ncbi:TetR/AcrR family transcriptional regulator C-terminal domain-containing protein [Streptosporangiaceae bacterium NEAU-GS5]|nr:TetR/AcrR family transcriptional regulator C-terminal domain-containing protein [Streptosporangiaceae bacterium NEAU-GS5]
MSEQDVPVPPWERPRKRPAPARVPLNRERIVDAAYEVLDREGLDRFSMRMVAAELGVAVSALYVHVANKDELLELMYQRLFEQVELPELDPPRWREQLKEYARASRARLSAHRDLARISMMHVPFSGDVLGFIDKGLGAFRAIGLPDEVAAFVGDLVSSYVENSVLEESLWKERNKIESRDAWRVQRQQFLDYFESLPADRFPNLVELSHFMLNEDENHRFELGLEIIVRGLSSYLSEGAGPTD